MLSRRSLLTGGALLCASPALGHSWYDPFCCNGKDCAPVADGAVRAVRGGWRVRLMPGDHPMVTRPLDVTIPHAEARPSEDGAFHVCVFPADTLRCLYVPQGGV